MWDPAVGGAAVVQPAATGRGPVPNGRCFVVTQERFLMIFGSVNDGTAGGRRRRAEAFAWCDQENPARGIMPTSPRRRASSTSSRRARSSARSPRAIGVIFWTAQEGLRFAAFLGCRTSTITSSSPTARSLVAAVDGDDFVADAVDGEQGVFSYDGTSILPVNCMVRPWIDDEIDPVQVRELSFAMHLGEFNEWWWFYPTLNSPLQFARGCLQVQGGLVDAGVGCRARLGSLRPTPHIRSWPTITSPISMRWQQHERILVSVANARCRGYAVR